MICCSAAAAAAVLCAQPNCTNQTTICISSNIGYGCVRKYLVKHLNTALSGVCTVDDTFTLTYHLIPAAVEEAVHFHSTATQG